MKRRIKYILAVLAVFVMVFSCGTALCEENKEEPGYTGEFLDTRVPEQNYIFVKSALTVFSNRWGPAPRTEEEREGQVWDQLLLSYEAFRRNIDVTQEEVDAEITNLLQEYKVEFDWKQDRESFESWVKEKAGEPAELFENQIRHLLQVEKLRRTIIESIQPPVTEDEAYQSFFDEYSSLSIELAQFDDKEEAEDFYRKARRKPKLWDKGKEERPDAFRKPGFVSLQFLMDIWRLPKDAVHKMLKMRKGDLYGPSPIYKGYAVFQILEARQADKKEFAKVKERYFDKVKRRKQHEGYNDWFKGFKEQANIKVYSKEGGQGE
ncbi:MAG: hypothetical protein WC301_04665 [Candidatus Omnitrophota bacterium]